MKKLPVSVILIVFLLLIICSPGMAKKPVTIYTYSSFPVTLVDNIKSHFQKTSGIHIDFRSFSDTGPLFNQLIREKRNPGADLVIGLDNNYLMKAVKADLFDSYRPKTFSKLPSELIFDRKYRLIPFDFGYIVFNYDSEKLEQVPVTHRELLSPYYKGKIIIENPLTSSPGQVFLLTTVALYGDPGYLDYWRGLRKNLLTITPGWDEAYGMYTNGEAPLVLTYGSSPVYHLLYDHTERYKALVLDGAAYAQIEGMGIIKGTSNKVTAQSIIEYILTPEFQSLIPENQFMYPVRSDITLPDSFRVAAKVKKILNLPPEQVEANLERWLSQWDKVMNE